VTDCGRRFKPLSVDSRNPAKPFAPIDAPPEHGTLMGPMRYVRGSELWALFFDARRSRWNACLLGRIERVDATRGALVGGKWYGASTWPAFGSQGEAETWANANQPGMPTAPEAFGNAR
jgi:hypothetical protein